MSNLLVASVVLLSSIVSVTEAQDSENVVLKTFSYKINETQESKKELLAFTLSVAELDGRTQQKVVFSGSTGNEELDQDIATKIAKKLDRIFEEVARQEDNPSITVSVTTMDLGSGDFIARVCPIRIDGDMIGLSKDGIVMIEGPEVLVVRPATIGFCIQ